MINIYRVHAGQNVAVPILHNFRKRYFVRFLHAASSTETYSRTSCPISVNIFVDKDIARHLCKDGKHNNNVRKTDLYLSSKNIKEYTTDMLRDKIGLKIEQLKNQPYNLRYKFVSAKASIQPKLFSSDSEVTDVLQTAHDTSTKLHFFVNVNPGVFPPMDSTMSENILSGMTADPRETETFTMLSFYKFAPIENVPQFIKKLNELWRPFVCYGRVYVAHEGVNAQMAVPTNILNYFQKVTESVGIFTDVKLNTDHRITRQEFEETQPFQALHIREKPQIVNDGFAEPSPHSTFVPAVKIDKVDLDFFSHTGTEVEPLDWHTRLDNKENIVLDCRNGYESDVGIFNNAIPLNTKTFSESWAALDSILKDKPKDTPILTYCTGGIRCVKINAYLQQRLGFVNTGRLKGGIISYTRQLELMDAEEKGKGNGDGGELATDTSQDTTRQSQSDLQSAALRLTASKDHRHISASKFRGVNYVFDERIAARVTEDVLTVCASCGEKCDCYVNCKNSRCDKRFLLCGVCKTASGGFCSPQCQDSYTPPKKSKNAIKELPAHRKATLISTTAEINNSIYTYTENTVTTISKEHTSSMDATQEALGVYADRHSEREPTLLTELRNETEALFPGAARRMLAGHVQGRFLAMLTSISGAQSILELGAFTGYSALCFAEGLAAPSFSLSRQGHSSGRVTTCEIDSKAIECARRYVVKSGWEDKIDLRQMKADDFIQAVRSEGKKFDIVFIDADKKQYKHYLQHILGETAENNPSNNDISNSSDECILSDGALILVDNTLWKGLVLGQTKDLAHLSPPAEFYGDTKRMNELASCMHEFNKYANGHPKLSVVLMPIRDGLTIMRYNSNGSSVVEVK